ncbi:MAG: DUF4870 domain-containing protein [Pseudopedobacter saltans]|uniref:DUF4870 domain-containing protein n=1 Tax=Pseudopedobacter saltans TaxID=151895 RepID=A0A2W5FCZ6_9SPHI|nr:MAG: DUF4870 domain-containing protein [Pseudopedobacter saltans]
MTNNGFTQPDGYYQQPITNTNSPSNDDRNMAMLAHVLAFFTGFIGPLIIYITKKDESPFVKENAVNVLNFQISLFIYMFVSFILAFVLIGFFLLAALGILHLIFTIMGAVAAHDGKVYKYPIAISFIS